MSTAQMRLDEVRRGGIEVLARELGPAGLVRFLQQFESGTGDYLVQRHEWLPDDVRAIVNEITDETTAPPSRTES